MFKLLLLDIDGTLTESNGEARPSKKVIEAVQEAQKRLHVAVATGRPYNLALPVVSALGLKGPSVFNGGAEILKADTGEIIFKQLMTKQQLREAVGVCLPFGYGLYASDDEFGDPITSVDDVQDGAEKLFIEAVSERDALSMVKELEAVEGVAAHPTSSWSTGNVVDIHVTHAQATKKHGIERLADMLKIEKPEIMAIGDHHNDLPMLMAAGYRVVMGDGPKEVQAHADFITATLAEDGVAVAIEKLILGRDA